MLGDNPMSTIRIVLDRLITFICKMKHAFIEPCTLSCTRRDISISKKKPPCYYIKLEGMIIVKLTGERTQVRCGLDIGERFDNSDLLQQLR